MDLTLLRHSIPIYLNLCISVCHIVMIITNITKIIYHMRKQWSSLPTLPSYHPIRIRGDGCIPWQKWKIKMKQSIKDYWLLGISISMDHVILGYIGKPFEYWAFQHCNKINQFSDSYKFPISQSFITIANRHHSSCTTKRSSNQVSNYHPPIRWFSSDARFILQWWLIVKQIITAPALFIAKINKSGQVFCWSNCHKPILSYGKVADEWIHCWFLWSIHSCLWKV